MPRSIAEADGGGYGDDGSALHSRGSLMQRLHRLDQLIASTGVHTETRDEMSDAVQAGALVRSWCNLHHCAILGLAVATTSTEPSPGAAAQ